jgi:Tol biopolymer transport system component
MTRQNIGFALSTLSALLLQPAAPLPALEVRLERVTSRPFAAGSSGDLSSEVVDATADGRFLLISTEATNLAEGVADLNGRPDLVVYDRENGELDWITLSHLDPQRAAGSENLLGGAISMDGRFVAFASRGRLHAPGAASLESQVYLFDRQTGTTVRASHPPGDTFGSGNLPSGSPLVSADGRYVAYESEATNLVADDDANNSFDIFLYDRVTGVNTLVTHRFGAPGTAANGIGKLRGLSADGRFVLHLGSALDLVAGFVDNNGGLEDLYLWDRELGASTLVSHGAGSPLEGADMPILGGRLSADGSRAVFYTEAANLVAGFVDNNGAGNDSFVFDRPSGNIQLVSGISPTASHDEGTSPRALSADGRYVFFSSRATDALPGLLRPADHGPGLFRFDTVSRAIRLINHQVGQPAAIAVGDADSLAISTDGEAAVFRSGGSELVAGMSAGGRQAFAYLFAAGAARLVSHLPGQPLAGQPGLPVAIGSGHRHVAFNSESDLLAAGDLRAFDPDAFVYDLDLATAERASTTPGSGSTASGGSFESLESIPAAGLFLFHARDLAPVLPGVADPDITGRDPLLFDPRSGALTALVAPGGASPGGDSRAIFLPDGLNFLLLSSAEGLVPGMTDGNGPRADLYAGNRTGGPLQLISSSAASATTSANQGIGEEVVFSANGRFVAYSSYSSDAVAGVTDTNGNLDVILHDRQLGTHLLVSRAAGSPSLTANRPSFPVAMSPDGELLIFSSLASNLIAGFADLNSPNAYDYFVYRRSTGAIALVSHSALSPTSSGTGGAENGRLSADGRYFVFASTAGNLVAGMTDYGNFDTFLYDTATGLVTLASHRPDAPLQTAEEHVLPAGISADGRYVLLASADTTLVAGGSYPDLSPNTFLYDRVEDRITLVSHLPGQPLQALGANSEPEAISEDGRFLVFRSESPEVLAGQQNQGIAPTRNLFLVDRASGERALLSRGLDGPLVAGNQYSMVPALGPGARQILFLSASANMAPHHPNWSREVFLAEIETGEDVLFRDGFELGNTSQWTQTVGAN